MRFEIQLALVVVALLLSYMAFRRSSMAVAAAVDHTVYNVAHYNTSAGGDALNATENAYVLRAADVNNATVHITGTGAIVGAATSIPFKLDNADHLLYDLSATLGDTYDMDFINESDKDATIEGQTILSKYVSSFRLICTREGSNEPVALPYPPLPTARFEMIPLGSVAL
jgi:hypothetical protein